MTTKEWIAKRIQAIAEHAAEMESGATTLDFEAWRVMKGYIVDHKPSNG